MWFCGTGTLGHTPYTRSLCFQVQFVVLSDDPEYCRRTLVGPDVIHVEGNHPVVDLAIASLCDHAVITLGTFGWWAAWFAGGLTITQANFPNWKQGSNVANNMRREDYYKPDWIAL